MALTRSGIAALLTSTRVVLGPMAGVTEAPFRGICKRMGAGLTYTEMVSAKGLHYNPDAAVSRGLLTFSPEETPAVVQLFGADPEMIAEQAARILERYGEDVAFIDVNMGCPVSKVVAKGEGSALMREPELAADIVRAVAEKTGVPVSAKFRSGWTPEDVNAVEFAKLMEDAGAAALCVHGRTRDQFYRGKADWDVIAQVKAAVNVPVIGSGDIFSADDVVAMIERTGVDAVMVARGAQGNPWIFAQAKALLERGEHLPAPTAYERIAVAREHARALRVFAGEHSFGRMRKHIAWYITGAPGATYVRERVFETEGYDAMDALLEEYRAFLEQRGAS